MSLKQARTHHQQLRHNVWRLLIHENVFVMQVLQQQNETK